MPPATALLLLGLGVVAVAAAGRSSSPRIALRDQADELRARAIHAQRISAKTSAQARELMEQWSAAERAAREAG